MHGLIFPTNWAAPYFFVFFLFPHQSTLTKGKPNTTSIFAMLSTVPSVFESQKHVLAVWRPAPFFCMITVVTILFILVLMKTKRGRVRGSWSPTQLAKNKTKIHNKKSQKQNFNTDVFVGFLLRLQMFQDCFNDSGGPLVNFLGVVSVGAKCLINSLDSFLLLWSIIGVVDWWYDGEWDWFDHHARNWLVIGQSTKNHIQNQQTVSTIPFTSSYSKRCYQLTTQNSFEHRHNNN